MTTMTRMTAGGMLLLVASVAWPAATPLDPPPAVIAGAEFDYIVAKGDSWRSLGSRHAIEPAVLASMNGRTTKDALRAGEQLRVDSRHLVPENMPSGIVINIPQRMLMLKQDERVVAAYPVGLGRPGWATFVGPFTVVARERDPVWDVPPSIQEELRRAGKKVITRVPPGPNNPLGKFWLGLSAPNFGIHGTVAPQSIFRFESHGCIRLHPDDIADLWARVRVGTTGVVIYAPILVGEVDDRVLLEAHPDIYQRWGNAQAIVESLVAARGLNDRVDWALVQQVLSDRDGRPHVVNEALSPVERQLRSGL